jgi:hypothetical protein
VHHPTGHSLAAHKTTLAGILAARRPRRDEAPSGDGPVMAIIASSGPRGSRPVRAVGRFSRARSLAFAS